MSTLSNIPITGLAVAAPNVIPTTDTKFGIGYSIEMIGGYQEVATLDEMFNIPINFDQGGLYGSINEDGMSSGRRRLGMNVYVAQTNKTYKLLPIGYLGNRGSGTIDDWFALDEYSKLLSLDPRISIINDYITPSYPTIGPITGTSTGTTFTIITGDCVSNIINPDDYSGVTVSPWVEITGGTDTFVISGSVISGTSEINLVRNDGGTGFTVNIAEAVSNGYQAFTGATVDSSTGTTISFTGHNNTGATLDLSTIVDNVYQAFTGATLSGTVIYFSGHNVSGSIDILSAITGNTVTVTGATITGTSTLNIAESNGNIVSVDLAPAVNNIYQAFTGATTSGTNLVFTGKNTTGTTVDLTSAVNLIYSAVTGATLSGSTLILNSRNYIDQAYDFSTIIDSTYKAYTGSSYNTTGKTLSLYGHNIPDANYTFSGLSVGVISGSAAIPPSGGTATGMTLTLTKEDLTTIAIELANILTFTNPNATTAGAGGISSGTSPFVSGLTFQQIMQRIFYPSIAPTITTWTAMTFVFTGTTPSDGGLAKIDDTYNIGLRLTTGTRGSSTVVSQPIKYQGLTTGMTISGDGLVSPVSGGVGFGSSQVLSTVISAYPVVEGYNTWYGDGGYNTGETPVYSDGSTYTSPTFTNSGTFAQKTLQFEGVYPIYATTSTITGLTEYSTLYSMISPPQIIIDSMVGESGSDKQKFAIPAVFTKTNILTIEIYNAGTGMWDNLTSASTIWVRTPYAISGVPYYLFTNSAVALSGARKLRITLTT